jgi:sugar O-acyltransferase (sialic acid O-acetyltransferase NeuD family)
VSSAEPLLVFPCNGNAVEALDCLGDRWRLLGFVDDAEAKKGSRVHGLPVHGRELLAQRSETKVLAVPGSPSSYRSRRQVIEGLGVSGARFARVVHPSARISPMAVIGRNVLIMAGVVVTSNAVIGDHVCILPNTVVHHDVTVGAWTLIGSNVTLAGGVELGENCYIGSGTSVMNGLRVGHGALVGLGSTLIRSVEPETVVAGNPARVLRTG